MYSTNHLYTNEVLEIIKNLRKLIQQITDEEAKQYKQLMEKLDEIYKLVESKDKEIKLLLRTTDNNLTEEITNKLGGMKKICDQLVEVIKSIGVSWQSMTENMEKIDEKFKAIIADLEAGNIPSAKNVKDLIEGAMKAGLKDIKEVYLVDRLNKKRKTTADHLKTFTTENDKSTKNIVELLQKPKPKILTVEVRTVGHKLCGHTDTYTDP